MIFTKIIRDLCDIILILTSIASLSFGIADCLAQPNHDVSILKFISVLLALIVIRQNADDRITKYEKRKKDETV